MGQFHFDVPDAATDFINKSLWQNAYICGIEGVPWQSRIEFDGSRLTLTRAIDSGVPSATSRPPAAPPSGPRSITQSAVLITSRSQVERRN